MLSREITLKNSHYYYYFDNCVLYFCKPHKHITVFFSNGWIMVNIYGRNNSFAHNFLHDYTLSSIYLLQQLLHRNLDIHCIYFALLEVSF